MGSDMTRAYKTAIAEVLDGLMKERGVDIAHLTRHSGLVRNAIVNILTGRTERPKVASLRAIARAVATNAFTREVDRQVMTRAERQLLMTARYEDPSDDVADATLELLYFYRLASREGARARAELFGVLAGLTPAAVRSIPRVLAGGPDTEGVGDALRRMGYP